MPCYHPIRAWRSPRGVAFKPTPDSKDIQLPCGRCIGCRLERSRQWALRLEHEKKFHDQSSFITLTYDEHHVPRDGSLNVKHFQDFMKRLRKWKHSVDGGKIRFFHAGEYGEKKGRPHYHAILFGHSFEEEAYDSETNDRGDKTWSSRELDRLWTDGMSRIGAVTFESAAYVARYVTKKISGRAAEGHYQRICETTGEIFSLKPEYATMSRRPGIGALHFEKYHQDIYPHDQCVVRGHPTKPPRFYDKQLEKINPVAYQDLKDQREHALALAPKQDRTDARLHVRETVKLAQIGQLKRKYEIV